MLSKEERHRLATRVRLGERKRFQDANSAVDYCPSDGIGFMLVVLDIAVCEYTYEVGGRAVDGICYPGHTLLEFALAYLERD